MRHRVISSRSHVPQLWTAKHDPDYVNPSWIIFLLNIAFHFMFIFLEAWIASTLLSKTKRVQCLTHWPNKTQHLGNWLSLIEWNILFSAFLFSLTSPALFSKKLFGINLFLGRSKFLGDFWNYSMFVWKVKRDWLQKLCCWRLARECLHLQSYVRITGGA